ncbi:MAG: response regulator [Oscillospiraceae bacterium]|nr:response regulator [Oscillospiraceae bacterium]
MKKGSAARIIIAAVLPFILVISIFGVVINALAKHESEKTAVQITRLYSEFARSGIAYSKYSLDMLLSENGTVIASNVYINIGKSLVSVLLDDISIQTAESISEFIRNPDGFTYYKTCNSYIGILPFYEDGELFFSFVDVPINSLPGQYNQYSVIARLFLLAGLAGLTLLIIAVSLAARKSIKSEKELLRIFHEKELQELKQQHEHCLRSAEERFGKENAGAASEMQSAFFGRVAHEIYTPMNSILGIAQIMLADNNLAGIHVKHVSDIKLSADTLLKTTNNILDLTRLQAGKIPLFLHDYNFIQLVDNVSAYARFIAGQKKLDYIFNVPDKLPQCLYGDAARLKQCLINIIAGTVSFTGKGSVTFSVIAGKDNISFEIHGMGKEPDDNDLGFSITKSIISLMNGQINFNIKDGAGSVFTVTIPRIAGDSNNLNPVIMKSDLHSLSDKRILIVDDNEINLHVAKGLVLSLYGIDCDIALSGTEALLYTGKNDYDLIFMDHMMPEPDGAKTTMRIRETNTAVPIIALTADVVPETKELLLKAGMNDFLAKPIVVTEMNYILQKWLPSKKNISKPVHENNYESGNIKGFGHIVTAAMGFPGLNVKEGLSSVAFNEEIYINSLKLLLGKIPAVIDVLHKSLNENNLPEFTVHVHGMKSSLSSVGASSLSAAAQTLEKAGKAGDINACNKTFPEFAEQLKELENRLALLFQSGLPANKKTGTRAVLGECMAVLTEAVQNYNYELLTETVARLSEHDFGIEINSDISKIKIFADNFDYDGITVVVSELKLELEKNPSLFKN